MTTILIVDDSTFSRGAVKRAIASLGHHIVEAANGREAIQQVATTDPDCVITDLLMPEMDGLQFLTELRQQGDERPVTVISADIQESSRRACVEQRVSSFLNKPCRADDILNAVHRMLNTVAE